MESSNTVQSGMGVLASFSFKGQCYDSGHQSKAKCTLCGRAIRLVYILKNPQDRSVSSGSCCFPRFRNVNTLLFQQLEAAQIWLNTTLEAERQDIRTYQPLISVKDRTAAWRALKHQALVKIRDYRRQTGKEFLPEPLFDLKIIAEKKPASTASARWFDNRIRELSAKI